MRQDPVRRGKFVVVVIHGNLPVRRSASLKQWHQTLTLHIVWNRQTGQVQRRWRIIDAYHPILTNTAGLDMPRIANHPGNSDGLIVHETINESAVIAKKESIDRGVD